MNLNDKIKSLIASLQMTPSHFADEIGVQRSSISHILSGRNRPSLEIIQRIVNRFPDITYEWLLEGSNATSGAPIPSFSTLPTDAGASVGKIPPSQKSDPKPVEKLPPLGVASAVTETQVNSRVIQRILIFYSDNTFSEYTPVANS